MFSSIVRFLLFAIVCLAIVHAYPPSMSKAKWIPTRIGRPHLIQDGQVYNDQKSATENDYDTNDNSGFATWLLRSRKFCCAPPL